MTKSLCKYSRGEIKAGNVAALVVDAQFYCNSCARTSNQKNALCKAALLSPKNVKQASQVTSPENKIAHNVPAVVAKAKVLKQQREFDAQANIRISSHGANSHGTRLVAPKAPITPETQNAPKAQTSLKTYSASEALNLPSTLSHQEQPLLTKKQVKQELKRLTKSLKAQKKQKKQIKKLLEKQRKVAKKHKKLLKQELKFSKQEDKLIKQGARIEKQLTSLSASSVVH